MGDALLVAVIGGIFGSIVTWIVKYFFDKKKELDSNQYLKKRESYEKLVLTLRGVLCGTEGFKEKFFEELNYAWLYASEDVLKKCYSFQDEMLGKKKLDGEKMLKLAEDVLKAMRDDLGLKNRNLDNLFNNVIVVYDKE